MLDRLTFSCPWCGQANPVAVEPDDAGQWIIQDCQVCCRPIELRLPRTHDERLSVRREDG